MIFDHVHRYLAEKRVEKLAREFIDAIGDERFALAESCTGGLLASIFSSIPGVSAHFYDGVVCYSPESKIARLGIDSADIGKYGIVSEEIAILMATKVRCATSCEWGFGITGIAGPGGGSVETPVGTICLAVAHAEKCVSRRCQYAFSGRRRLRYMACESILRMARTLSG